MDKLMKEEFKRRVNLRVNKFCRDNGLDVKSKTIEKFASIKMLNGEGCTWERDILNNPYILMKIEGVGFVRADGIAMQLKFPYDHHFRILAYVGYSLETLSKGSTILSIGEVLTDISSKLNITDNKKIVQTVLNKADDTYKLLDSNYKVTTNFVEVKYLTKSDWYYAESKFYKMCVNAGKLEPLVIKQSIKDEVVNKFRFKLNEGQSKAVEEFNKNGVNVLTGFAGCLPDFTEVLTEDKGWIKIKDYKDESIMEIDFVSDIKNIKEHRKGVFRKPLKYHKLPVDKFYHMKNKVGTMDLIASEYHSHPNITKKCFNRTLTTKELLNKWENNKSKPSTEIINIPETFEWFGDGIKYSDEYIRLKVAVFADGSFHSNTLNKNNLCHIRVKKQRKKDRIVMLLNANNISYTKCDVYEYTVYGFEVDNKDKEFGYDWFYKTNRRQREIIIDELKHWDGSICTGNSFPRFTSTLRSTVNTLQLIATSLGYRTTLIKDKRIEKYSTGECFNVTFSKNKNSCRTFEKSETNTFEEVDAGRHMYCFTTTSGYFLMRQNDKIYVTGNCGKTAVTKAILDVLKKSRQSFTLLAPTGISSKVLSDLTGYNASTIHSRCGSRNKIQTDWIIMDECSMYSVEHIKLLTDCIEDLKKPPRLIFIGDISQLTPIAPSDPFNCLIKLMEVGRIKGNIIKLTEIMRASDETFIPHLCKMFTDGGSYDSSCENKTLANVTFYELDEDLPKQLLGIMDKHKLNFKETYVISPQNVGEHGNNIINSHINEVVASSEIVYSDSNKLYRVGSELLHTKNNRAMNIYNGERITLLEKINDNLYLCEKLDDKTKIEYEKEVLADQTILSYGLSVHKCQGLTVATVIFIASSKMYHMLSRQLVYTGLSRASKNLIILKDKNAMSIASKKSIVDKRVTFLGELAKL